MLRGVQGNEVHILPEYVDGGTQFPVNAAGIGQQAHPLAFQALEAALAQHLYSGFDLGGSRKAYCNRRRTKKVTKKVATQHSITSTKNPI